MRQVTFVNGPEAWEGTQLCAMCVMLFKNELNGSDEVKAAVREAESGTGPDVTVDVRKLAAKLGLASPANAVTTAPVQLVGGMLLPVCWSHVNGLNLTSVMPATALPPGAVPLLGQRKR